MTTPKSYQSKAASTSGTFTLVTHDGTRVEGTTELAMPSPGAPRQLAIALVRRYLTVTATGVPTAIWVEQGGGDNGTWFVYRAGHWHAMGSKQFANGPLAALIEDNGLVYKASDGTGLKPFTARARLLSELEGFLMVELGDYLTEDKPGACLKGAPAELEARSGRLIPFANGLYDYVTGELLPHTPAVFYTHLPAYGYDPDATCPQWEEFISQTFAHDTNGALALQEYFGYVLSGRIDLQKAFMLIGPPRAGKGVITRVLGELVGNVAATTLISLARDQFALAPLERAGLITLADMRGTPSQISACSGVLLEVIAGDPVSINVKNRPHRQAVLPGRIFACSNELPEFRDNSQALASRFIYAKLVEGHLGKEDPTLAARLLEELPGIAQWALQGLRRLNEQGRFTTPDTMAELKEEALATTSPMLTFLEDTYEITGAADDTLPVSEVHAAYRQWAEDTGAPRVPRDKLIKRINALALRGVVAKQTKPTTGPRQRIVTGLKPRISGNAGWTRPGL
ncbi:DNA primase family protein [Corynebacterium argentoratense]|uniref:DNA primase family protein n=1 Tax=Corynebacterium argentoratense TaxID=42817 RepID=UPI001F327401|nr:phage/plasmid primase, P4 family [Corynebacterium argentoratense]